nr:hypothetical protein [Tanacetum cinerariifolium]
IPIYYDDDDDDDEESYTPLREIIIFEHPPCIAITPILSTKEPKDSIIKGDEHLDTIFEKESDKLIKSSFENLVSNPSEFKDLSNIRRRNSSYRELYDNSSLRPPKEFNSENFDAGDMLLFEAFLSDDHSSDFKTKSSSTSLNSLLEETNNFNNSLPEFTTFSKVLFDAECESDSSDDQSCFDEDVLEKIVSKPLCEEEIIPMKSLHIRLIQKLLYDNSSPRPPKEFVSANSDAASESFSPSPILLKDSDSLMEEIDLFCTLDYPMPPGIKDKDYDSERDILIPKDLPSNNFFSFAEKESFHFDIPLFSHPPAKLPDDRGVDGRVVGSSRSGGSGAVNSGGKTG